ncbi:MAG: phosphatase PAP2 family protein [Gemmatimonadaceae bacterium]
MRPAQPGSPTREQTVVRQASPRVKPRRVAAARPLALAAGLSAVGFTLLAIAVDRGATAAYDRRARRLIRPLKSERLTKIARVATNIANPHVHPLLATVLALGVSRRAGRTALAIPLASIGATVVDRGVRYMIHQSRPPKATHHPGLDRYAFPSGHTCAATAIGLAFAAQTAEQSSARFRHTTASIALSVAIGIAWTRLYLDEHWIDDILGGWLAGIAVAGVSVGTTRALISRCDAALRATTPPPASPATAPFYSCSPEAASGPPTPGPTV